MKWWFDSIPRNHNFKRKGVILRPLLPLLPIPLLQVSCPLSQVRFPYKLLLEFWPGPLVPLLVWCSSGGVLVRPCGCLWAHSARVNSLSDAIPRKAGRGIPPRFSRPTARRPSTTVPRRHAGASGLAGAGGPPALNNRERRFQYGNS